jgi:hypothetical protein
LRFISADFELWQMHSPAHFELIAINYLFQQSHSTLSSKNLFHLSIGKKQARNLTQMLISPCPFVGLDIYS